jgi:hypothetical protein
VNTSKSSYEERRCRAATASKPTASRSCDSNHRSARSIHTSRGERHRHRPREGPREKPRHKPRERSRAKQKSSSAEDARDGTSVCGANEPNTSSTVHDDDAEDDDDKPKSVSNRGENTAERSLESAAAQRVESHSQEGERVSTTSTSSSSSSSPFFVASSARSSGSLPPANTALPLSHTGTGHSGGHNTHHTDQTSASHAELVHSSEEGASPHTRSPSQSPSPSLSTAQALSGCVPLSQPRCCPICLEDEHDVEVGHVDFYAFPGRSACCVACALLVFSASLFLSFSFFPPPVGLAYFRSVLRTSSGFPLRPVISSRVLTVRLLHPALTFGEHRCVCVFVCLIVYLCMHVWVGVFCVRVFLVPPGVVRRV